MHASHPRKSITLLGALLSICLLLSSSAQAQTLDSFYAGVDAFMENYVTDGRVNYAALHQEATPLTALVDMIGSMDTANFSSTDHQAFLVNAYNVLVIQNVVDHYPIASPLDVAGFFDQATFTVASQPFTLNELEKGHLYTQFPDARLHFALVCAAQGCPVLINQAYRGATLDEQLNTQTRLALNSAQHVQVNHESQEVNVSELFSWYAADFSADNNPLSFINQYREEPVPAGFSVGFITYDWKLNE